MGKGSGQYISEAYLAADQLMRFSSLVGKNKEVLNLAQAIEEGAVVVFHLPTVFHNDDARAVASLVVWSVMCETAARSISGKPTRHVQLAIDEYPQVAAAKADVDAGLTMTRKFGLHFYLLFQDFEQLKTSGGDLGPIIRGQCQRIVFSAKSRAETDELRDCSLDVVRDDVSSSLRGMGVTTGVRGREEPGLTRNEIVELSAKAMKAYAVLNLGDRHRDPIPFTIIPPTKSVAEHNQLKNTPLPMKSIESHQVESNVNQTADEAARDRRELLLSLADKIASETAWQLGGTQS